MKEEVAALWKEVFNDADEFVKLFFDNVYKPENTLVAKRFNRIVSALQIVPYKVKINDLTVDAAYICGVCTRESERGRGFMNRLMNEATELVRERGFAFSFLIPAEPWLFDVYRRLGFIREINARHQMQDVGHKMRFRDSPTVIVKDEVIHITTYSVNRFNYFNGKQWERSCAVLHNNLDFQIIIKDCELEGGKVFTALENEKPVGMAFTKPSEDETVLISEIFYDSDDVKKRLTDFAGDYFDARKIVIQEPSDCLISCHDEVRYGLACVHDEKIPDISRLFMTLMLD